MGMLDDRIALVTGGRGGVGRAVCERFEAEGATVYAGDLSDGGSVGAVPRSGASYHSTSRAKTPSPPRSITCARPTAISTSSSTRPASKSKRPSKTTTLEEVEPHLRDQRHRHVPDLASTRCRCCAAPRDGHASIINFGSYDGFIADPGLAAYCATKGAVHALTKAMACDHGPEGIRVNAICPGYVDTPMLQSFLPARSGDIESLKQAVRDVHPLRTYGTPTDIANLVNWLASDEARYASGQLWVLDGGLSAQVQQMRL